ncbi:hypothetical protein BV25DRAFT_1769545, partial [Artomyces pyxidatus]
VPNTFEALCQWAYVHYVNQGRDLNRRHLFLHQPVNPAAVLRTARTGPEVNIRFQGFLGQCNLKPLGNWRGTLTSAHRAVQFLQLVSGPFTAQMKDQVCCVDNIKNLVLREILTNVDPEEGPLTFDGSKTTLSFQRRVFTRSEFPPSLLTYMDDPSGTAGAMHKQWRVTNRIAFGRKMDDGGIERCSHHLFNPGDFIDVTARIDI